MLAGDERKAREMHAEVEEQCVALQECSFLEGETLDDSARFLRILQVFFSSDHLTNTEARTHVVSDSHVAGSVPGRCSVLQGVLRQHADQLSVQ